MSLRKGLIGHWTMNDADTSGGTLYDSSARDRHGILGGSISTGKSSIIGQSFLFDGSGEYVATNNSHTIPSNGYTLAQWIKGDLSSQPSTNNYTLGWDNKISLTTSDSNNTVRGGILIRNSANSSYHSVYSGVNVLDGKWHHWAATVDRPTLEVKIYIDGQQEYSETIPDHFDGSRIYIDGAWSKNSLETKASISDSRIYNRPLSANEVRALYNMRSQRQNTSDLQKGLKGHWTFNTVDTDSNILRDSSANDNHAEHRNGVTKDQPSIIGESYSFNGGEYLAVQNIYFNSNNIGEFCIAAWVNIPSDGGNWSILDYDRSEYFTAAAGVPDGSASSSGDYVGFHTSGGGGGDMWSNKIIRDGNWHHVVWQQNEADSRKEIWIDGSIDSTQGCSGIGSGVTRFGFIGDGSEASSFDGDRNNELYSGRISDLQFYSLALSESKISRLYQKR